LVECGRHLNIELVTLAEVIDVTGEAGNFTVQVKKHPRYIDMQKCIACGVCAQKCPKKVDDEFNQGVSKRRAAYIKYGQSVPLKYAIDGEQCIFLTKGKCRACEKFCPTGAINFDDREEIVSIHVGAVILAPGFKPFDPSTFDFYGYRKIPDVVTSLEYERLLSAGGPFMGHLARPSDHAEPRRIAWIQCVGSRSTNRCDNGYCSSVCCMYAIKQSLVTKEHLKGPDLQQTIFYMDIRSHGKEFERYYEDAQDGGVRFLRARPHTIEPGPGHIGVRLKYVTEDGRMEDEMFDMAVLSIGLEAPADGLDLAKKFNLTLNANRFADTSTFEPVTSSRAGVFVTGAFLAPKAIPRSVTEASSAAAEAAKALIAAKGSLTHTKTYPAERAVGDQTPRVGVFVCSCGINIAGVVDVRAVAAYARCLPHVVYVENNLFTCSADTQDLIAKTIKEQDLNRIVIAACTPRTHEPLFQDTLKGAGLNGFLMEMANIRNQNAWVHQNQPEKATAKAKDQVRMAVSKVVLNAPLTQIRVPVTQRALVIGGGVAGMQAALNLARRKFEILLIEKTDRLGGNALQLTRTSQGEAIGPRIEAMIAAVEDHPRITVLKKALLRTASGSVGNFISRIDVDSRPRTATYGAAVIAIGARESVPDEYLYGQNARVMTHLTFDTELRDNAEAFRTANSAVFIQCVGSRDQRRPYCSRVCCSHSMKNAIALKTINPDIQVFVLYRDIRTYSEREALYRQARNLGVIFIRYDLEHKPVVNQEDGEIYVDIFDSVSQSPLRLYADYLVLAAAIEPYDTSDLVSLYKCGINADGFINEAHPKLRPVDMPVEGLFVAGICNYPKPLDETISQATAAAGRAAVLLSKTEMQLDAIKSFVTEACDGCALCLDVCPYHAITLESYADTDQREHRRIRTDPALCKGCGVCAATCPKGGVHVHGFTLDQLRSQVSAALAAVNQ
jgi:heterodisulfide reductase subunit A